MKKTSLNTLKIKKQKLQAFTLVELAITLIITGIVIAFTLSSYLIILNLHNRYKEKTEKINHFEKLRYLIIKDNLEAYEIKQINNGFIFIKDSSEISYLNTENSLIRNQINKKDTFYLKELNIKTSFQNIATRIGENIDLIQILFEEEKQIIITKEYAIKELMK